MYDDTDAGSFWLECDEEGRWLLYCEAEEEPIAQFDTHNQALLSLASRTHVRYIDD